ncbi:hypothetical protein ABEB36_006700 [Hypothenemus hampei]
MEGPFKKKKGRMMAGYPSFSEFPPALQLQLIEEDNLAFEDEIQPDEQQMEVLEDIWLKAGEIEAEDADICDDGYNVKKNKKALSKKRRTKDGKGKGKNKKKYSSDSDDDSLFNDYNLKEPRAKKQCGKIVSIKREKTAETAELVKSLVARESDLINKKKIKTKDTKEKQKREKKSKKKDNSLESSCNSTLTSEQSTSNAQLLDMDDIVHKKAKEDIDSIIRQADEEYARANLTVSPEYPVLNTPRTNGNQSRIAIPDSSRPTTSTDIETYDKIPVKLTIQNSHTSTGGFKGFENAFLSFLKNSAAQKPVESNLPKTTTLQQFKINSNSTKNCTSVSLSPIKRELSEISREAKLPIVSGIANSVPYMPQIHNYPPQNIAGTSKMADLDLFDRLQGNRSEANTQTAGFHYRNTIQSVTLVPNKFPNNEIGGDNTITLYPAPMLNEEVETTTVASARTDVQKNIVIIKNPNDLITNYNKLNSNVHYLNNPNVQSTSTVIQKVVLPPGITLNPTPAARKPNTIWNNQSWYGVNTCPETVYENKDRFYPMTEQPIKLQENVSKKEKEEANHKVIVEKLDNKFYDEMSLSSILNSETSTTEVLKDMDSHNNKIQKTKIPQLNRPKNYTLSNLLKSPGKINMKKELFQFFQKNCYKRKSILNLLNVKETGWFSKTERNLEILRECASFCKTMNNQNKSRVPPIEKHTMYNEDKKKNYLPLNMTIELEDVLSKLSKNVKSRLKTGRSVSVNTLQVFEKNQLDMEDLEAQRKNPSLIIKDTNRVSISINDEVWAKHRNKRYYKAKVIEVNCDQKYRVYFKCDKSFSNDITLRHFVNWKGKKNPQSGDLVQILWSDGMIYEGECAGEIDEQIYKVLFEDLSLLDLKRDHIYALTEFIPKRITTKLSHASEMHHREHLYDLERPLPEKRPVKKKLLYD